MRSNGIIRLIGPVVVGLLCVACSSAGSGTPDWTGAPADTREPNPIQIKPALPGPAGGGGSGSSSPGAPSGGPSGRSGSSPPGGGSSGPAKTDPDVVATNLSAPVGLTLLPDDSALVGERTTGRILRVQPIAGQPTPTVKTLTGLDATGDGGLLDLALSPHYREDGLIYAYVTTAKDNRVVDFTLTGPVTPVLTGIPKGTTGNPGRLAFAGNGDLYVGTGDAGRPALAQRPSSLAGKVLRISDIGEPAPGNPDPSSPIYTRGHNDVAGLCSASGSNQVFEIEARASGPGEVNVLAAGADYGWPDAGPSTKAAAGELPPGTTRPGGCAAFSSTLYVASLDGARVLSAPLSGRGAAIKPGKYSTLTKKYGRIRTAVGDPAGAIWLTTSNKDGHGKPIASDERVIRIPLGGGSGGDNPR